MTTLKCSKCGRIMVLNQTQEQMLLWSKKCQDQIYVYWCDECKSPMMEVESNGDSNCGRST